MWRVWHGDFFSFLCLLLVAVADTVDVALARDISVFLLQHLLYVDVLLCCCVAVLMGGCVMLMVAGLAGEEGSKKDSLGSLTAWNGWDKEDDWGPFQGSD